MSEPEFTPGPWLADDVATVRDSNGYEVCNTLRSPLYDDLSANEYLIAAAPVLYQHLSKALSILEDIHQKTVPQLPEGEYIEGMRRALAKARGEL